MLSLTCSISGISFSVPGPALRIRSSAPIHPIFQLSPRDLFSCAGELHSLKIQGPDLHLLNLALITQTGLVEFHSSLPFSEEIGRIHFQWAERLLHLVIQMQELSQETKDSRFPKIIFNAQSGMIPEHLKGLIEVWSQALDAYRLGKSLESRADEVSRMEQALERLVRNKHKSPASYASKLASWAAIAANFPSFQINSPDGELISLSAYWQKLIILISKTPNLPARYESDVIELEAHLLENLDLGTLYSGTLLSLISRAKARLQSYLEFGDFDVPPPSSSYKISEFGKSDKDFAAKAMAPSQAPKREDYPDLLSYVKAKARFLVAQEQNAKGF